MAVEVREVTGWDDLQWWVALRNEAAPKRNRGRGIGSALMEAVGYHARRLRHVVLLHGRSQRLVPGRAAGSRARRAVAAQAGERELVRA